MTTERRVTIEALSETQFLPVRYVAMEGRRLLRVALSREPDEDGYTGVDRPLSFKEAQGYVYRYECDEDMSKQTWNTMTGNWENDS